MTDRYGRFIQSINENVERLISFYLFIHIQGLSSHCLVVE